MKTNNGKTGGELIWGILNLMFDRDSDVLEQHLIPYLAKLVESDTVKLGDFYDSNAGITKII